MAASEVSFEAAIAYANLGRARYNFPLQFSEEEVWDATGGCRPIFNESMRLLDAAPPDEEMVARVTTVYLERPQRGAVERPDWACRSFKTIEAMGVLTRLSLGRNFLQTYGMRGVGHTFVTALQTIYRGFNNEAYTVVADCRNAFGSLDMDYARSAVDMCSRPLLGVMGHIFPTGPEAITVVAHNRNERFRRDARLWVCQGQTMDQCVFALATLPAVSLVGMTHPDVQVLSFMDDFIFIAATRDRAEAAKATLFDELSRAGLEENLDKSQSFSHDERGTFLRCRITAGNIVELDPDAAEYEGML